MEYFERDEYRELRISDVFENPEFSDCQIHVEDKVFHVSKFILSLKSDVFRAYFRNDTKEKKSGIIKIDDLDPTLVEKMLEYMYDIEMQYVDEIVHDLYVVAERYNVRGLMKFCIDTMLENLDQHFLPKYLELSFQMNIPKLRQEALKFAAYQLRMNNYTDEFMDDLKDLFQSNVEISCQLIKEMSAQERAPEISRPEVFRLKDPELNNFLFGNSSVIKEGFEMSDKEFEEEAERIIGRAPDFMNRFLQIANVEELQKMISEAELRFMEIRDKDRWFDVRKYQEQFDQMNHLRDALRREYRHLSYQRKREEEKEMEKRQKEMEKRQKEKEMEKRQKVKGQEIEGSGKNDVVQERSNSLGQNFENQENGPNPSNQRGRRNSIG